MRASRARLHENAAKGTEAVAIEPSTRSGCDAEGDSSGSPVGWQQGLAAAKGGSTDRIAVLGLFGDNDQPGAICEPLAEGGGAEPSARLGEFVALFGERGLRSSVCADHYGDAFADLLDVLDSMCQ